MPSVIRSAESLLFLLWFRGLFCCLGLVFQVRRAQSPFLFRNADQRGIKLDKGGIDSTVLGVARIAGSILGDHFGSRVEIETEECPFSIETRFVFDMDLRSEE